MSKRKHRRATERARHKIDPRLDPDWREKALGRDTQSPREDALTREVVHNARFWLPDYPWLVGVEWLVRMCDTPNWRGPSGADVSHLAPGQEVGMGDLLFRGPLGLAAVEVKAVLPNHGAGPAGTWRKRLLVRSQGLYYAGVARKMFGLPTAAYAYTDEMGIYRLCPPT